MLQLNVCREFCFDEAHYLAVCDSMYLESATTGKNQRLMKLLGQEELLNYVSCVWYTPNQEIAIEIGKKASPLTRHWMNLMGAKEIVGVTPKFPISNPSASEEENQRYVEELEQSLKNNNINYIACLGRARDFRSGGDGCYILACSPQEAMNLLLDKNSCPTQLAILHLCDNNPAKLISCVDN